MLKIWGRLNSINVQKVLLCAEELGLDYERTDAGMHFGVVNTPEFRKRNPNGLVPTIDDDGFTLWESNAILRYLCAKHARFYPGDLRERAGADRWMDWQLTVLNPPLTVLLRGLVRAPGSQTPEALAEAGTKAEAAIGILDQHLKGRNWVGGEEISMADFALAPFAHRWFNLPHDRESRPDLDRYYAQAMGLAGARSVLTLPMT